MQPNNQPFATNYLDTIATAPVQKKLNPFVLWGLMIAVVAVLFIVVTVLLNSGGTSTDKLTTVGVKLASLEEVSTLAQPTLKSSELRTVNSSLTLVLTNSNRDIEPSLTAAKIKVKDAKSTRIIALNTETEELNKRLEDARLNGVFDSTYAREMSFYIKTVRAEISTLYNSTKSASLKTALEKTDKNLAPILDSFVSYKVD